MGGNTAPATETPTMTLIELLTSYNGPVRPVYARKLEAPKSSRPVKHSAKLEAVKNTEVIFIDGPVDFHLDGFRFLGSTAYMLEPRDDERQMNPAEDFEAYCFAMGW
jgi:hypothetical protein